MTMRSKESERQTWANPLRTWTLQPSAWKMKNEIFSMVFNLNFCFKFIAIIVWSWLHSKLTTGSKPPLTNGFNQGILFYKAENIWIFIYLKSSFTWVFIWTHFIDQLPVGLLAQLVERCIGIAEVMDSNPVRAWNFFSGPIYINSFL